MSVPPITAAPIAIRAPKVIASIHQRLSEAEAAYHSLALGRSAVEVRDSSGEAVKYRQADFSALARYIADLKRQIAGFRQPKTIRFNTSKGV
ncbi:gpW family head-tail joining protein [Brevundimonas sp. TWP2-3-4b2]|uniref:gpW family head-tail joining protein n=1 Tax=Brevundimonas sp. TWP2-3-4b2 TaxID=2804595 RepID=UPI003CEB1066